MAESALTSSPQPAPKADLESTALSQRYLLAAGYQPKDDWVFIEDLVEEQRHLYAGRDDLLGAIEQFLSSTEVPVTRVAFRRFCGEIRAMDAARRARTIEEGCLRAVYNQAGIEDPGAEHRALAMRIVELERAVKQYAARLRSAEERQASGSSSSGLVPFAAGILIGKVLF